MTELPNVIINDPTKEVGYFAQRSGLLVVGKQGAEVLGESIGETLKSAVGPQTANNVATAAGALNGIGGLVTIGLAAAVSAGLTQMDYYHRKDNLKELYKEEIATKLGKPAKKIGRDDLDTLGKGNRVIQEELNRSKKQRNFGVGLSFIASMAALAVISLALPAVLGMAMGTTAAVASHTALTGVGGFLLKAAVGLMTYHTVKDPLHFVADKLFDIDKHTTNDRIVSMKRDREMGKAVSREEVLAVFVAANPRLDNYIKQEYGQNYDALNIEAKRQVAQELSQYVPLDKLTMEINAGKVNVTELAFAVEGEASGVNHLVKPVEPEKRGLLGQLWDKMTGKVSARAEAYAEAYVTPLTGMAAQTVVMQYNEAPEKSFVEKLGKSRKDTSLSHVERLENTRNEPTVAIPQP